MMNKYKGNVLANIKDLYNFKFLSLHKVVINYFFKVFFLIFLITSYSSGDAQIRYVKPISSGNGSGSSWANASANLQQMINTSTSGQQVWVQAGVYKPKYLLNNSGVNTNANDRANTFTLKSGVSVYGGFSGNETIISARNFKTNSTILSGDIGAIGSVLDNNIHVVTVDAPSAVTILDGFTVSNGNANINSTYLSDFGGNSRGGGIYCNFGGTNFKLQNCVISSNNCSLRGGGMLNIDSSPTILNCSFVSNKSDSNGGGIATTRSSANVINCNFIFNSANYGAGIRNLDSYPIITNCTFTSNNASLGGGGIYSDGSGTANIKNTIFWSNIGGSTQSIYGPATVSYSNVQGTALYPGTGNINTNPMFFNVTNFDGVDNIWGSNDDGLQLTCNSPCKNAGNNIGVSAIDIIGNSRIINNAVDMGAYELYDLSTIYVNKAATGLNNGTSWANAYTNLQVSINTDICSPATIWVAKGTYYPTHLVNTNIINSNLNDRNNTFTIKSGVSIYGGFLGTETTLNSRNSIANITILSGNLGLAYSGDNSYHVATADSFISSTILDGFTIKDGNANNASTFLGIANGNFNGGGIFVKGGSNNFHLQNCIFDSNFGGSGGGVYTNSSSMMVDNCTFIRNSSNDLGGGMNNQLSSPIISNCAFSLNVGRLGGGMYILNSTPKIINCTFTSNTAISGGGIFNGNSLNTVISNCTLFGNSASSAGGAIYNTGNLPTITNSVVWGNTSGGTAGIMGSAIVTYSNVQGVGVYAGAGNINSDPYFISTSNLIGPDNIWRTADDGLQLSCGSPCKNSGTTIPTLTTDILNLSRPQGSAYDMGAYERGPSTPSNYFTYTAGAWSPSSPSSVNASIVFNDNFSSLATDALVGCECTVNPGKVVTLLSGSSMTLNEGITVDNVNPLTKMTFENNAHLIQINPLAVNSGKITFKHNAQPMFKDDYTYWNSPVTLLSNFALSNLTNTTAIYSWRPTILAGAGGWNSELATSFMNPTKGYIAAAPSTFNVSGVALTKTVSFYGVPNNGNISVPISRGLNANIGQFLNGSTTAVVDNDDEWNLIGNPYPSPIDALAFLNDNMSVLKGTIYFWSHHTAPSISNPDPFYSVALSNYNAIDYAKLNSLGGVAAYLGGQIPSQYIASGQSFFAQGIPVSGNAIFKNTHRFLINSASFFRQNNTDLNRVWLNMETASGIFSQILIGYHPEATLGLDSNYDGLNLSVNSDCFYSVIADNKLAIQGRPAPFDDSDIVPLGIKSSGQNNFRISIDHFDASFNNQNIYLKDNLIGVTHDLKTSAYLFSSDAGDFNDRFELVYRDVALSTANNNTSNFNLLVYKKNDVIVVNSGMAIMNNVKIYDIQGRLLLDKNINSSIVELNIGDTNQVIFIKTTLLEGQVITKKLVN